MKKLADTEVKINKLLAERWSPKAFNPEFIIDNKSLLPFKLDI